MNYTVDLMEMATQHDVDHVVDNLPYIIKEEDREERYVIVVLCFATPIEILTKDGIQQGVPGDCMIVAPTFPEYHRTRKGEVQGFVNDWIHVSVAYPNQMEEIGLPVNTLIHTGDPMFLRDVLEILQEELLYRQPLHELLISNLIEQVLIRLARAHQDQFHTAMDSEYRSQLLSLRQQVQESLHQRWTVEQMAQELSLSASRFSTIYRNQFHISPVEDVIEMRITSAKRLLISTGMNMKQIALSCGFQNEYYFSRMFKKRVGITPSAYRRK